MKSCTNCANKTKIGGIIKCNVTGRVKTMPFTACDAWQQGMKQSTLNEVDE